MGGAAASPRSRSSVSRSGKVRGGSPSPSSSRRFKRRQRRRPRRDLSRGDAVFRRRRQPADGRRHDPADPDEAGRVSFLAPTGRPDVPSRSAAGGQPAAAGGGPLRSGPPQERVPGDARARAAQPAGADQQRRAGAAPGGQRRATLCNRRPRCWSARSARWRGWSTTCST